jgi:hypothetical protein
MTTDRSVPRPPRAQRLADRRATPASGATLPEALVDEHARLVRSRSTARKILSRARARRRLVPPLVVGSGALLGSGVVGAWVFGQTTAATVSTTSPSTSSAPAVSTTTAPDQVQLGGDVAALDRLRQALSADEAAIAGLSAPSATAGTGAAVPGPSAASKSGAPPAAHSTGSGASAGTPASGSPVLPAAPSGGTALAPVAPLPSLPMITVPPTTAPPVHTTTGATVVAP